MLEAIKDLVTDANFDCAATGFSLQAMDSSHVSLVSLMLRSDGFDHFRCDRSLSMGMNLNNVAKMLKCAGNDDIITMKAEDSGDTVTFMFESQNQVQPCDTQAPSEPSSWNDKTALFMWPILDPCTMVCLCGPVAFITAKSP